MNLDETIAALQEAKEHCVDGRSKVLVKRGTVGHTSCVTNIEYDSNNVIISYE